MSKRISQREARRLRKRVAVLEDLERRRYSAWAREYPSGTHVGSISWPGRNTTTEAVRVARLLGHAVIVTVDGTELRLYATRLKGAEA